MYVSLYGIFITIWLIIGNRTPIFYHNIRIVRRECDSDISIFLRCISVCSIRANSIKIAFTYGNARRIISNQISHSWATSYRLACKNWDVRGSDAVRIRRNRAIGVKITRLNIVGVEKILSMASLSFKRKISNGQFHTRVRPIIRKQPNIPLRNSDRSTELGVCSCATYPKHIGIGSADRC